MRLSSYSVTGLLMSLVLTGCSVVHKPSDQTRRASFGRWSAGFTGNRSNALNQAYFLLAGTNTPQIAVSQSSGGGSRIELTVTERSVFNEGLAVGLEPDGYLLTASHVLGPEIRVFGRFGGEFQVKAARLVYANESRTLGADLAVIKVAGRVDHCAVVGEMPVIGDPVFAAVGYRSKQGDEPASQRIGFAAGSVLEIADDPTGSPVVLIATDVPLWLGDSGSPLLSGAGQLIGVNSACQCSWRVFHTKRRSVACMPRRAFLQELIARDRAAHPEPNRVGGGISPPVSHTIRLRLTSAGQVHLH